MKNATLNFGGEGTPYIYKWLDFQVFSDKDYKP